MDHRYGLLDVTGVEIEYAIVDRESLAVRSMADQLLETAGVVDDGEVELGDGVSWSNELALHQLEMKTSGPVRDLAPTAALFQSAVVRANRELAAHNARLLPGGMHPFMQPTTDFKLWPHSNKIIYSTFDRLFDCRRHGWANVQSVHINLSFASDEEFKRLHAAIRVILPLLPALAASSPIVTGSAGASDYMDRRLEYCATNTSSMPSIIGSVIPEPIFSRADYEEQIYGAIERELRPLEPGGLLRPQWTNARGAIARFDRGSIEIRLLDTQECPRADLAVVELVRAVVVALVEGRFMSLDEQMSWPVKPLVALLDTTSRLGDEAIIVDRGYLQGFGLGVASMRARDFWLHLYEQVLAPSGDALSYAPCFRAYAGGGCLARRILASLGQPAGQDAPRGRISETYQRLAACLEEGTIFA